MIVNQKSRAYSSKRTTIHGRGFVDTLKGIGSYVYQNKDLIAKPMLGAVGDIGALAMVEATKALIRKATAKRKDPESEQIIQSLLVPRATGSGIKRF